MSDPDSKHIQVQLIDLMQVTSLANLMQVVAREGYSDRIRECYEGIIKNNGKGSVARCRLLVQEHADG